MTPDIPAVCFLEDIYRVLRVTPSVVKRLRRHGAFPIKELPALDKHPRWSGDDVRAYLAGKGHGRGSWRRDVA